MKKLALVAVVLLTAAQSFAETQEIIHMSQIFSVITPENASDTVVVFDLDNTVMEPPQTLGTDQWFKDNVKRLTDEGTNPDAAIDQIVPEFISVHQVTRMVPTEADTPQIIRALQEKGVRVMALTARPVVLAERTIQELASIGVDFTLKPVYRQNVAIGGSKTESYVRGIALISPHGDKGLALITFLKQIQQTPKNLVFIDDTPKNVVSVETALNNTHYPYRHTSFRYGFDDRKVQAFSRQIGDIEWKAFVSQHILLSDSQAGSH